MVDRYYDTSLHENSLVNSIKNKNLRASMCLLLRLCSPNQVAIEFEWVLFIMILFFDCLMTRYGSINAMAAFMDA